MRRAVTSLAVVMFAFAGAPVCAQSAPTLAEDLARLTDTPAVTGYETALTALLQQELAGFHPQQDAMGNMTVTFGSGAPHRLIVTSIDEPGYVVSGIEPDGYLRVQRLPQTAMPRHYNEMQNAQPMAVMGRDGRTHPAVTAALSIHLEPGRQNPPDPDDIDNLYIDMGARSAEEVRAAGVDLLSPIAAERHLMAVGETQWAGTAVGDRYGAAVLLQLARALGGAPAHGTVTLAFAVQEWAGTRGLTRLVQEFHPDELLYVGRPRSAVTTATGTLVWATPPKAELGSGLDAYDWVGSQTPAAVALEHDLAGAGVALHHLPASSPVAKGYGPLIELPARTVHLGVPLLYPVTAGETLDQRDVAQLLHALAAYLGVAVPESAPAPRSAMSYTALPPRPTTEPAIDDLLRTLTQSYGVSGAERMTREAVEQMLPAWAHPTTDESGNLILRLGSPTAAPTMAFVAHTDELGFRVRAILPDGTLDLENKGGGTPALYWGHPAVVHTSAGMRGAVVALPDGYDSAQFHFPTDFRAPAKLYVGADSPQAVAALGIQVGDTVTIRKRFLQLEGRRVSIRSLDDRVGCTALVRAVWELGPEFHRNVTFVWSTREELGLEGAGEFAARAAAAGQAPATVFAIDTFVSSDTPLESKRFADAEIGHGFAVRAVDNSSIVPLKDVERVQEIAKRHNIPVQVGVTGGGNDGATFLRYGSINVALSWPLRYAHSPAELIDVSDLQALSAITTALAREW